MNWSDFDLAIGWQTTGNYADMKSWLYSFIHRGNQGELTEKYMTIYMLTLVGFYIRLHLIGPSGYAKLKGDYE
jgi:hypothetical protein